MYSNHINLYYHQPYIQEHYYPTTIDDRQLGSFFLQIEDAYSDTPIYGLEALSNSGSIQYLLVEPLLKGTVGLDLDGFIPE